MIQIRNIQLKLLSSRLSLSEHFSEDLNQLIVLERKGSSASWNSAKNEEYRDRWLGPGQSWESTVSAVMMIPVGM